MQLAATSLPAASPCRKAWNVSKAAAAYVLDGGEHVAPDKYAERLRICDDCQHRGGNSCSLCGCDLATKAKARAWHCPLALWPGDQNPEPEAVRLAEQRERARQSLLLSFPHGFGDAVQLTTVLLHLRRLHNDWHIDIACKRGVGSLFKGLCRDTYPLDEQPDHANYAYARHVPWPEPTDCLDGCPSSKPEWCLKQMFGIDPITSLCRYEIRYDDDDKARAAEWLSGVSERRGERFNTCLIHYQGNSARSRKDLDERMVEGLLPIVRRHGLVPVILDWEQPYRSSLIEKHGLPCPGIDAPLWQGLRTGDGATLAALIEQSSFLLGIDSGPEHAAGATSTPTMIVWRKHHPVHYYGLDSNVLHFVTRLHERHVRGPNREAGLRYFREAYRHHICTDRMKAELPIVLDKELSRVCHASLD